jgi:hypothetical protein
LGAYGLREYIRCLLGALALEVRANEGKKLVSYTIGSNDDGLLLLIDTDVVAGDRNATFVHLILDLVCRGCKGDSFGRSVLQRGSWGRSSKAADDDDQTQGATNANVNHLGDYEGYKGGIQE